MTTTHHTPGPWNVMGPISMRTGLVVCRTDGLPVADVSISDQTYGLVRERDQANARLIAAAPELLEALKEAKDFIYIITNAERFDKADAVRLLHQCWDAIAKAEGA